MFKRLWHWVRRRHEQEVQAEAAKMARITLAEQELAELQGRADAAVIILTSQKKQDAFADAFRTSIKGAS